MMQPQSVDGGVHVRVRHAVQQAARGLLGYGFPPSFLTTMGDGPASDAP